MGFAWSGQSREIPHAGRFDPRRGQKRATRIRYLGLDMRRGRGREELRELHVSDCEVAEVRWQNPHANRLFGSVAQLMDTPLSDATVLHADELKVSKADQMSDGDSSG